MKIPIISSLLIFFALSATAAKDTGIYKKGWIDFNKNGKMDPYENPAAPIDERVSDLLQQMTLEEKTCQLATLYGSGRVLKDSLPTAEWKNEIWKDGIGNIDEQHNGLGRFRSQFAFPYSVHVSAKHTMQRWFVENTRLGIPVDYTNEGIRGLCHYKATSFPAQCGQGASWNTSLIERIAHVEALEADALGYTNIYSPILDLSRDPRWGRVVECYSEEPYLASELGRKMIEGLQSHNLVATPKHFAVYSIPVGGRDEDTRTDPHVAPREMHTLLLEPFRVAFQEAGALGVMSSYNDYDGEPVSASHYFLTELLREKWGFKGYVVSDSEAVEFVKTKHSTEPTHEDAAAAVVNAGLNVRTNFTPPEDFILPLRAAITKGKVSQSVLNQRVAEVLKVKFMLGLFDNPYRGDGLLADKIVGSAPHQEVALDACRQSIVLLKNENGLLPLSKDIKRIALVGPNADEVKDHICRYGPAATDIITVRSALETMLPNTEIIYSKGCDIRDKTNMVSELYDVPLTSDEQSMIDDAVEAAKTAEVVIAVMGGSERTVRESFSRSSLELMGRQNHLLKALKATGKPIVLVLMDGRAATINWADDNLPAIMHAWFGGKWEGTAVADVLFGNYNPGGKLPVTFPRSVGQIPFAFPFKPGSDTKGDVRVSGALYEFGYGLSYTTFDFSNLKITQSAPGIAADVTVSLDVTNTGKVKGDEVVQLYIRDRVSSLTTYVKRLSGFERVSLEPGQTKSVTFKLNSRHLGLINKHNEFVVEPGDFDVMVGASCSDIKLKGEFTLN